MCRPHCWLESWAELRAQGRRGVHVWLDLLVQRALLGGVVGDGLGQGQELVLGVLPERVVGAVGAAEELDGEADLAHQVEVDLLVRQRESSDE